MVALAEPVIYISPGSSAEVTMLDSSILFDAGIVWVARLISPGFIRLKGYMPVEVYSRDKYKIIEARRDTTTSAPWASVQKTLDDLIISKEYELVLDLRYIELLDSQLLGLIANTYGNYDQNYTHE